MDTIFKALGDPTRRAILDMLRAQDGQSLSDIEARLSLSRFGVMKHLKVLEDAHLVVTKKVGRFKYHYLNPLPLQEAINRWIDPFLKPQVQEITTLKAQLENEHMKPDLMIATYIDCTHDALWDALTKGELMAKYHFSCEKVTGQHGAPGDQIDMFMSDNPDRVMLSNRVISIDPKSRIEMDFTPGWVENPKSSRCIYLLDPQPRGMKLTIEHYDIQETDGDVHDGWTRFAAGLKTYLETGKTLRLPMGHAA